MNAVLRQQHEEHKARRARMSRVTPRLPATRHERPVSFQIQVDAHVRAWRLRSGDLNPRKIIFAVAHAANLDGDTLCSDLRLSFVVRPRQVAMYLVHHLLPDLSLPRIGQHFGGRDHTTVLHAVRHVKAHRHDRFSELILDACWRLGVRVP